MVDSPTRILKPWAADAGASYRNVVPVSPPATSGLASWSEGFPPVTFLSRFAGGIPPKGADANGGLNQISSGLQWLQAGGPMPWDSAFATAIGGYPLGAIIASSVTSGLLWVNISANNTTNPDAGGAGWVAAAIAGARIRLLQNITFYVAMTGNDNNSGLSAGSPFLTIQKAATTIQNGYDLNGFVATISIAPGTYSNGAQLNGAIPGTTAPSSIVFSATGGSVVVNGVGVAFAANQGAMFSLAGNGFTLAASAFLGLGSCLISGGGARIDVAGEVTFSTAAVSHILAVTGGQANLFANCTVSGAAQSHLFAHAGGVIVVNGVGVTLSGIPNFTTAYAFADECGVVEGVGYTVLSGSATGVRFSSNSNAAIRTGGGPIVFPGSLPGNTDGFGFYG